MFTLLTHILETGTEPQTETQSALQVRSTYHTVNTEQECSHSEPEGNACGLAGHILDFIIVHSTEHVMTDGTKHIDHLVRETEREGETERGGEGERGRGGDEEGERERGRGRRRGREGERETENECV